MLIEFLLYFRWAISPLPYDLVGLNMACLFQLQSPIENYNLMYHPISDMYLLVQEKCVHCPRTLQAERTLLISSFFYSVSLPMFSFHPEGVVLGFQNLALAPNIKYKIMIYSGFATFHKTSKGSGEKFTYRHLHRTSRLMSMADWAVYTHGQEDTHQHERNLSTLII